MSQWQDTHLATWLALFSEVHFHITPISKRGTPAAASTQQDARLMKPLRYPSTEETKGKEVEKLFVLQHDAKNRALGNVIAHMGGMI